jgi:hypothetical protein
MVLSSNDISAPAKAAIGYSRHAERNGEPLFCKCTHIDQTLIGVSVGNAIDQRLHQIMSSEQSMPSPASIYFTKRDDPVVSTSGRVSLGGLD